MTDVIAPRVRAVENMVARAQSVTQGRSSQSACLTCEATLWVTFFFDGTGNHRELHFPKKHSNVAALFDAHENDQSNGVGAFYYEGIGMPFDFKDRYEARTVVTRGGPYKVEEKGYNERESAWNQAFGTEIDKRLEKAMFDFQNFVESWRRKRRVDEINVAAFGFSRGSATARAFFHWMRAHSKITQTASNLAYDGIPVNIKFLGVFDTVESIGTAGENQQPELIKTSIPSFVQKSLQVIAAHELRHAFPITVLGTDRYKQVVYPGAHADVGGGYSDLEQGRRNSLARIGLLQMLDEARGAGLKMQSVDEMRGEKARWEETYKYSFDVSQTTRSAFFSYMSHVKMQAGPINAVFESHCALYRAWIDTGLAIENARKNIQIARKDASRSSLLSSQLVEQHLLSSLAQTPRGRGATVGGGPQRGTVAPEVEEFFENYVHDSFEHFSLSGGTVQKDLSNANYYKIRDVKLPKA